MKYVAFFLIIFFTTIVNAEENEVLEAVKDCNSTSEKQLLCGTYLAGVEETMIYSPWSDTMLCSGFHSPHTLNILFTNWTWQNKDIVARMKFRTASILFMVETFSVKKKKECLRGE
jgi:hypothetical protein